LFINYKIGKLYERFNVNGSIAVEPVQPVEP
jgi:hypothetical protein